jgi:hypothetical protein
MMIETHTKGGIMEQEVYEVIDLRSNTVMGTYKNKKMARKRAEKLNCEYGAQKYGIKGSW